VWIEVETMQPLGDRLAVAVLMMAEGVSAGCRMQVMFSGSCL